MKQISRYTLFAREPYTRDPNAGFRVISNHNSYIEALNAGMKHYDNKCAFKLRDNFTGKVVVSGLPALGYLKKFIGDGFQYQPN